MDRWVRKMEGLLRNVRVKGLLEKASFEWILGSRLKGLCLNRLGRGFGRWRWGKRALGKWRSWLVRVLFWRFFRRCCGRRGRRGRLGMRGRILGRWKWKNCLGMCSSLASVVGLGASLRRKCLCVSWIYNRGGLGAGNGWCGWGEVRWGIIIKGLDSELFGEVVGGVKGE